MAATENVYKLGRQRGPGDRSLTRRAWDQPLYALYSNIIPVVKLSNALYIIMDVSFFVLDVSPLLLQKPSMLSKITHCDGIGLPFFLSG